MPDRGIAGSRVGAGWWRCGIEGIPPVIRRGLCSSARTEAGFLERYGRPAAVLMSPKQYEKLTDVLEDADDVDVFDAAMAKEGENMPWGQVKADLGNDDVIVVAAGALSSQPSA